MECEHATERASLIAAAPEILEALKEIERWWLEEQMPKENGAPVGIFMVRAAIAKAEGREVIGGKRGGNRTPATKDTQRTAIAMHRLELSPPGGNSGPVPSGNRQARRPGARTRTPAEILSGHTAVVWLKASVDVSRWTPARDSNEVPAKENASRT